MSEFETNPNSSPPRSKNSPPLVPILRGIGGAIVGSIVGYFGVKWLASQGLYAMIIPGALLGLGFGLASQYRNSICGIVCGVAALIFGLLTEWSVFPFVKDGSLSFFLQNLGNLKLATWLMIGVGSIMAFWFGKGR